MDKINLNIKGAKTIMETEYPKRNDIIENLIPSYGLVIFAGSPKVGKSWFVLHMLLSVCYDMSSFIGHKVLAHGSALYLALEDSEARIKERITKLGFTPTDNKLEIACKWRPNELGVSDLSTYLKSHPDTKIICIDTKGKFSEGRDEESFQSDYTWMGKLKTLADNNRITIVLITHLRKKKADEDPYESVSGTTANTAVADTILMLKRARTQTKGVLSLTSRDIPEFEQIILFDTTSCEWKAPENENEFSYMTNERMKIINAFEELNGKGTVQEIANKLNDKAKNVSNRLASMVNAGIVKRTERGSYTLNLKEEENEDLF